MQTHATSFPNGCALGATWSKRRLYEVGRAVGLEARGLHNGFVHMGNRGLGENGVGITMYAPNMNLVRDPRWGRAQEVYSEDPRLSGALTYNFVTGAQGNASVPYMLSGACCKHYAAYDIESIPRERYFFDAVVDARNMWETYLPVFYACVVEAKAAHVMCSYNALNGVPTCADGKLMNGLLRDQWRWTGFVVSDYDAWAQIRDTHHYCDTYECAAAAGINAGMDQEGGGTVAINALASAIAHGRTTEAAVNVAFRRLFFARIRLGMLDPPTMNAYNYITNGSGVVESAAHIRLARQAGREAMCLYKSRNGVLPLDARRVGTVALIGPQCPQTALLLGNYARVPDAGIVSLLEGVAAALGINITGECTYEQDIDYFQPGQTGTPSPNARDCCKQCTYDFSCNYFTWYDGVCYRKSTDRGRVQSGQRVSGRCTRDIPTRLLYAPGCTNIACPDQLKFDDAVAVARRADAVIVTVGLDQDMESEGHDRATIDLPDNQYALVSALRAATDKPLIAVLIHGGTFALKNIYTDADAIVDAWYPGMQGGHAIADVLFGTYNPAGRASVTYYARSADLPAMGNMNLYAVNGSNGITYRYFKGEPQIPFGFGLSYTTFQYVSLRPNVTSAMACDPIGLHVSVRNVGTRAGDEVVQVYVRQPRASVPVPELRLADFERVEQLQPGEQRTVQLTIMPFFHAVVLNGSDVFQPRLVVERGPLQVYVGGGQPGYFAGHLEATIDISASADLRDC